MKDKLPNGRTKKGQEHYVLGYIRRHGGASIFWITENQRRACAVQRLQDSGEIVREMDSPSDLYPWCVFTVRTST